MYKSFLSIACFLGALTVGMGAFGAHGLKAILSEAALSTYETAIRYQFYHVLALGLTGLLCRISPNQWYRNAGIFFCVGILFFCGSLYLLTYQAATGSDRFRWAGPVTPVGGLFFIAGWIFLGLGSRKS